MQMSFFSIGEEAGQVKYVKAGQKPFGQFCCLTSSSLNNCSKFMHGHCKYTGHTAVLWTHGEQSRKSVLNYCTMYSVDLPPGQSQTAESLTTLRNAL